VPIFFFNVQRENYVEDTTGVELKSAKHVPEEALSAAQEILSEGAFAGLDRSGWSFKVTDEKGQPVFTLPFSNALRKA
jgi:hypothetical protein